MAKILVVDDSSMTRSFVSAILQKDGHQIEEADGGRGALEKLNASAEVFDLVIADVNMPDMDGMTLSKNIRANERLKNIPIFIATIDSTPEMKAMGKSIGVTAWIAKPLNPANLSGAVKKVLGLK